MLLWYMRRKKNINRDQSRTARKGVNTEEKVVVDLGDELSSNLIFLSSTPVYCVTSVHLLTLNQTSYL